MIALVDYGLGNIKALENIYHDLGLDVIVAKSPSDLRRCSRIILPGVGAFNWAMTRLNASGMREALDYEVIRAKKPVLGICIGMQILAKSSEEGDLAGLGWIDSRVVKFDPKILGREIQLPHMGWNDVQPVSTDSIFSQMTEPKFYFLHSYYIKTTNNNNILASANYGIEFTSAVRSGNIFGTQFHPEKSHQWGIQLLKNFADPKLC